MTKFGARLSAASQLRSVPYLIRSGLFRYPWLRVALRCTEHVGTFACAGEREVALALAGGFGCRLAFEFLVHG
jgi:hypothetical protein